MAALTRLLLILFAFVLVSPASAAMDKKLTGTVGFGIFLASDVDGSGLTGKTFADLTIEYACTGDTPSVIDESGDTLTEISSGSWAGYYWALTNDSLGCTAEEELLVKPIGTGIESTPRLAKAVEYIESDTKAVADAVLVDTGTDGVKVGADAIGASQIAADAIGASEIAAAAITVSEAPTLDADMTSRMAEASINTTAGAIDNVTLVATTTTNTDMRGTDSAIKLSDTVDGMTVKEMFCAFSAQILGKTSGAGTTTMIFRNVDDDTNVLTTTLDSSYNRTDQTLVLTGCD